MITASDDKTARVWDARTAVLLGQPLWHEDHVGVLSERARGFRPGADYKLATYDQSVDYFKKVAAASKYVKLVGSASTCAWGRSTTRC